MAVPGIWPVERRPNHRPRRSTVYYVGKATTDMVKKTWGKNINKSPGYPCDHCCVSAMSDMETVGGVLKASVLSQNCRPLAAVVQR